MNDRVKITLKSGKGGDGAISFRHEKSVEKGGPYGGNGGRGGSIYLVADEGINSLAEYRFGKVFSAADGENGKSKLCYGKDAKDIYLRVPVGTVVEDLDFNVLFDLDEKGKTYLAVKGGRGGRGNASFKSSTRRTPNTAENGMPGVEKSFYLEMKLIADVGLVGFPNAGKSTLISSLTRAHPEIAPYPFTTLTPSLGVCYLDIDKHFVIADIPGLIKGASEGKGLGFEFLRHIERCKILLFVIDISTHFDPLDTYRSLENELLSYKKNLSLKRRIIALNKIDSVDEKRIKQCVDEIKEFFDECYLISAKEKMGLKELKERLFDEVKNNQDVKESTENKEVVYKAESLDNLKIPVYKIIKREDHVYEVIGERVIRTKKLINLKTDEGVNRFLSYLDRIGLNERLEKMNLENGDSVIIDDFEFEYYR